jgi:hypothetical protein
MARLSKAVKRSLLSMAHSASFRKDFEAVRKNRHILPQKDKEPRVDAYLEFLDFANAFANHARKPLSKINESNYKL